MRGLICKDFFVMKKQLGYYLAFFVVYGVLAVTGVFPASILSALVAVIAMMVPMSSIAYDDQAHWGRYAAATPAGRSGVVAAKYLFTLLVLAACAVLVAVLAAILSLTGLLTEPLADLLAAVAACMGVAMVMDAILLPLLFRFGAEKSRTISMIFFIVIFGGCMLLGKLAQQQGGLPRPPAWLANALPALLAILAVGTFVLSYWIAQGIYEKKEL